MLGRNFFELFSKVLVVFADYIYTVVNHQPQTLMTTETTEKLSIEQIACLAERLGVTVDSPITEENKQEIAGRIAVVFEMIYKK